MFKITTITEISIETYSNTAHNNFNQFLANSFTVLHHRSHTCKRTTACVNIYISHSIHAQTQCKHIWLIFFFFLPPESKQMDIYCQAVHLTPVLSSFLWSLSWIPTKAVHLKELQLQSYHLAKGASFKISSLAIIFNMLSTSDHTTWTHRSSPFSQHHNSPSTVDKQRKMWKDITILRSSNGLCSQVCSSSGAHTWGSLGLCLL